MTQQDEESPEETVYGERVAFMEIDEDSLLTGVGIYSQDKPGTKVHGPGEEAPGRYVLVRVSDESE